MGDEVLQASQARARPAKAPTPSQRRRFLLSDVDTGCSRWVAREMTEREGLTLGRRPKVALARSGTRLYFVRLCRPVVYP
jgi:hypothetical protein